MIKELSEEIIEAVKKELGKLGKETGTKFQVNGRGTKEGMKKVEEKLTKILDKFEDNEADGYETRNGGFVNVNAHDEGEEDKVDLYDNEYEDLGEDDLEAIKKLEEKGVTVVYPNLKYRRPKYQNVSEVLKYSKGNRERAGVIKLVIMNFND